MVFADSLVFEVAEVDDVVEHHTQSHCVPERSEPCVLAGDILGSVGMDQPHGARGEATQREVLGHILTHIPQFHIPQATRHCSGRRERGGERRGHPLKKNSRKRPVGSVATQTHSLSLLRLFLSSKSKQLPVQTPLFLRPHYLIVT